MDDIWLEDGGGVGECIVILGDDSIKGKLIVDTVVGCLVGAVVDTQDAEGLGHVGKDSL